VIKSAALARARALRSNQDLKLREFDSLFLSITNTKLSLSLQSLLYKLSLLQNRVGPFLKSHLFTLLAKPKGIGNLHRVLDQLDISLHFLLRHFGECLASRSLEPYFMITSGSVVCPFAPRPSKYESGNLVSRGGFEGATL
jgi:hypothetical protein